MKPGNNEPLILKRKVVRSRARERYPNWTQLETLSARMAIDSIQRNGTARNRRYTSPTYWNEEITAIEKTMKSIVLAKPLAIE